MRKKRSFSDSLANAPNRPAADLAGMLRTDGERRKPHVGGRQPRHQKNGSTPECLSRAGSCFEDRLSTPCSASASRGPTPDSIRSWVCPASTPQGTLVVKPEPAILPAWSSQQEASTSKSSHRVFTGLTLPIRMSRVAPQLSAH